MNWIYENNDAKFRVQFHSTVIPATRWVICGEKGNTCDAEEQEHGDRIGKRDRKWYFPA
jgi:hypothetical protein